MKKLFLLLAFFSLTKASDDYGSKIIEQFEKYRFNAPWIIKECMLLKPKDLPKVWQVVVETLIDSEKRWYYFCDKRKQFDISDYWHECVWQCKEYYDWMKELHVDTLENKLVECKERKDIQAGYTHIFDHWQNTEILEVTVKFYCFYIDSMTNLFNDCINHARENFDDQKQYSKHLQDAKICLKKIMHLIELIESCSQYAKYKMSEKSLLEILQLLELENKKEQSGGHDEE